MDDSTIYSYVDHTLLSPTATWDNIQNLCEEAIKYKTACVCIPPSFVQRVKQKYNRLNVCTVIGFPLGYSTGFSKTAEVTAADIEGADEFDVVINIGDVKDGDYEKITDEISFLKSTVGYKIVKIIIETCYLTTEEKIALCKCVTEGGANYIKTSTGFGTGGATIEDIRLFKQHIGPYVKIKAAGGMKTREDFVAFINEGCSRLGTSSAVKVLSGGKSGSY